MASLVFSVGVVALVPVVVGAVRTTRAARDLSMATWLAWQKLEELRGPGGLAASPAATLTADTPGYVDYPDEFGRPHLAPGVYTRRWQVEGAGGGTLRVVVSVMHAGARGAPVTIVGLRFGGAR